MSKKVKRSLDDIVIRDLAIGDIGRICEMQAETYKREYNFNIEYEILIARIMADYAENRIEEKERAWVAVKDGKVVGSIFCVRIDNETAKLRLLCVAEDARGIGLGGHLVKECVEYARSVGYKKMRLWTQSNLTGARRLYDRVGFVLTKEDPVTIRWGCELQAQEMEAVL